MATRDYYTILGITRNAGEDEIRKAYRGLARKYHPDINKNATAQEHFKEINEAYETLKDPEKRKLYDMYGAEWQRISTADQNGSGYNKSGNHRRTYSFNSNGEFGENDDFSNIFDSIFGGDANYNFRDGTDFDSPDKADEAELQISIGELISGADKTFTLQTIQPSRNGSYEQVNKTLKVKIPKGVTEGSAIRLSGQGSFDPYTGKNRDLLLRVSILHDPRFTISGIDLHTTVPVSPWEAILGGNIPVETIEGSVHLTIPARSRNGKKLRLRGKGLPGRDGTKGDIIVELEVHVPDNLSNEEERLLRNLASISRFNPRKEHQQRCSILKR